MSADLMLCGALLFWLLCGVFLTVLNTWWVALLIGVLWVLNGFLVFKKYQQKTSYSLALVCFLSLSGAALGCFTQYQISKIKEQIKPGPTTLSVTVLGPVQVSESEKKSYRFLAKTSLLNAPYPVYVYINMKESLPVYVGNQYLIDCVFHTWDPPDLPGEFDLSLFYLRRFIVGQCHVASSLLMESIEYPLDFETKFLVGIKKLQLSLSLSLLPKKENSTYRISYALLSAILLGDRQFLTAEDNARLSQSGLVHILSVSGLHITAVAYVVYRFFYYLLAFIFYRRTIYFFWIPTFLSVFVVAFYVLLSGSEIPAIRSAIMACVVMLSHHWCSHMPMQKRYAIALFLCVLIWPNTCLEPGFVFSFLSILALIQNADLLEMNSKQDTHWIKKIGFFLCTLLWSSLVATLISIPLSVYYFHSASLFGVFSNLVAVPIANIVIIPVGILWIFFKLIHVNLHVLVDILLRCCWLIDNVAKLTPNFLIIKTYFTLGQTCVLAILALLLKPIIRSISKRRFLYGGPAVLLLGSVWFYMPHIKRLIHQSLDVYFLPVGQGDSTLIVTARHETMLIDGGGLPHSNFDPGARVIIPFLQSQRINSLDHVVLTHAHPDHFLGLIRVIKDIPVKYFWWNGQAPDKLSYEFQLLMETLQKKHVPIRIITPINRPNLSGININLLHPITGDKDTFFSELSLNNNSIVLAIEAHQKRILLMGDSEFLAEDWLITHHAEKLYSNILKIGHHGSKTSSTLDFLNRVMPQIAVIPVGRHNHFGHPHQEVLSRLNNAHIQTFRTDEDGLIEMHFCEWFCLLKASTAFTWRMH